MAIDLNLINSLRAMLNNAGNPMRGNFYMAVVRAYSADGSPAALASAHQALMQAQISTYSGAFGAAAMLGNWEAKKAAPNQYNLTLDTFSYYIATRMLDAMEAELLAGGDGILAAPEIRALDYSVWRELGMGSLFPGDAQRYWDYVDGGNPLSASSIVFNPSLYAMHRFGADPNYQLTYDARDDDLWKPSDLLPTRSHGALGLDVAAYYQIIGKTPEEFGLSSSAIRANGDQVSADGRYQGHLETLTVRDSHGANRSKQVVTVTDTTTGEYVIVQDLTVDLFESGENGFVSGLKRFLANSFSTIVQTGSNGEAPPTGVYVNGQVISREEMFHRAEDALKNFIGADLDSGAYRSQGSAQFTPADQVPWLCFAAGTGVAIAGGIERPIERVSVGDSVLCFDSCGPLEEARVTAVHRNVADRLVRLSTGVYVTPTHPFLCADGEFRQVWRMIQDGVDAVDLNGEPLPIRGELLTGAALRDVPGYLGESDGLHRVRTYNLTVERHHTYVAGGFRVHNTSLPDQIPPGFLVLPTPRGADGVQVTLGVNPLDGSTGLFAGRDIDGDGNTDLEYATIEHPAYSRTITGKLTDNGLLRETRTWSGRHADGTFDKVVVATSANGTTLTTERVFVNGKWVTVADTVKIDGVAVDVGTLGSIFGSQLGRLVSDNPFTSALGGVVLGAIGENFAEAAVLSTLGRRPLKQAFDEAFADLGIDLQTGALGALSSYLAGQLVEELGLEGVAAGLANSAVSAVVGQVATNLTRLGQVVTDAAGIPVLDPITNQPMRYQWNTGVNVQLLANAAGSFLGTWLASRLVQFDTISGQIGAQLGAAIGAAWVGSAFASAASASEGFVLGLKLGSWAGPVGALIGAFVGYILGGLIGSLFGGGSPRSGADIGWVEGRNEFWSAVSWSKNGGSADAARGLAQTVVQVLNGVITSSGAKVLDGGQVRTGSYGTYKRDFVYLDSPTGQITFRTRDANALINYGSGVAVADLVPRLAGGDIYVKRAVAATVAQAGGQFDVNTLLGNIAVAQDFSNYLRNSPSVNALLTVDPHSAFAATWAVTLARVLELDLTKRNATDWIGGWTAFMDEALDGKIDGAAFTPANLVFDLDPTTKERAIGFQSTDGQLLGVVGDTIDSAAKEQIAGTAGADSIVVAGNQIANMSGLTLNGAAASGAHTIDVAATIDGGDGNDTIVGGDLGNDLLGGDGNDTLVGGKLDDWLLGGSGNDRLFAGAANYQFTDGNATATAAALAMTSNGDLLDGGDGDDVLYGSAGSDWLRGGSGNDILYGGAGADILDGGTGNDRGPNGEAHLLGGSGTDQYLFGYGDGSDVLFDEADNNASPGATGDSLYMRMLGIAAGTIARNWAGGGSYEVDGSVKGGEDAVCFGPGIGLQDLILTRSGTDAVPGSDLIIQLTVENPNTHARTPSGDQLVLKDWFEPTRRVEWLRFADGQEIRIGDISSFVAGSSGTDVIVGSFGADFLAGGDGNDTIRGLAGNDFGFGGGGNDLVAGDENNDWVTGGSGDDQVIGGLGNDTVFGDDGADYLYGGDGSDILAGGRGNDQVVGGAGDDIFRYERGDGTDIVLDDYVDNWDLVWQNGSYVNGYVLDSASGTVSKNGTVVFDGTQWLGVYDYTDSTQTMRRNLGAVNGVVSANSGNDTLEFAVGIDIQDLMLRRDGNDLAIAIGAGVNDARGFDAIGDRITIKDWYTLGAPIENFVFAATGKHAVSGWTMSGAGTDGDDTLTGTSGVDWITGNAGNDVISGGAGDDILAGNGGMDRLRGDAGADVLYGGDSDDVLEGGAGADILIGGTGVDLASYANATATGMRAFLNAPNTNTLDGTGDIFMSIEGLEGTSGNDKLGGDDGDNVLRGLGGNDTLYGGAGNDIYEFDLSHGVDTILDAPFVTEEVLDANGALNTALFTATWVDLGFGTTAQGNRYRYQLVVTRNGTGQEVYRSRDSVDFIYTSPQTAMPAAAAWPFANGQWLNGAGRTGNGVQTTREVFQTGDGGRDTIDFGAGIGLSDLTFTRLNGGADLQITYQTGNSVTITGQNDPNRAIETLQLRDGLAADLTHLRVLGEAATADGDFMVGDANANTLDGLAGDDILSGGAGNDILRGGDGNDILEGGLGSDTLDGGADSVSAGLTPSDLTSPFGDTIRYVRSNAAVTINLETGQAAGGHAAGDTIVRVAGVSTIENVTGSDSFGDTLTGDSRANRLYGLGGNDTIDGRAGNDVIGGGLGNDTLRGSDGDDNLSGDEGDDILRGGNGNDLLIGGTGVDDLSGDAGDDTLNGGDDNDFLSGDAGNDRLSGDAGADQLSGGDGDDQLDGGDGDDTLYGGDGNDVLKGGVGDDWLDGEAGDDTFQFDAASGSDTIADLSGQNRISIAGATRDHVWMTRVGDDLRISVIGGATNITVLNYYLPDSTQVREVALSGYSLFLSAADPLIQAMTQYSADTPPAEMPANIAALLSSYWFVGNSSAPMVTDQTLDTNEDTPLTGAVGATDADNNIASYAVQTAPTRGTVTLDAATGTWIYAPGANLYGQDTFQILVTDAENQHATQTITVNVASVNDAPSDIALAGAPAGIAERDHPVSGTLLDPIVLGTLSATDVDAPDAGDFATFQFSVTDARFEVINGTTLRLKAGVALDFETTPTVSVDVTVRDRNGAPEGLSYTKTFTFNVLDRDDYFYGTAGADTITGQAGRNLIYGFGGNDVLTGANAADTLDGGDGADQLFGLGGDDTLDGGLGDDALDGGAGNDILHGGDGTDALFGQAGADQLFGDVGADQLQGGDGDDQLDGGADNDRLEGGAGNDRLVGGTGDDVLIGGTGADHFLGGAGVDTVSYETATTGVTVDLAAGTGTSGDAAGDVFEDTPEVLIGSAFGDTLTGSAGGDTIEGRTGDDIIYGGAGNDILRGGEGNDTIDAGSGNDVLDGGAGNDILIGGDDSDTYLIGISSGADEIRNFDPNGDDIDVVGYQDITNNRLWFERSGNDLIVTVVGSDVRTTVKDWYVAANATDRANYKIDFFLAGNHVTQTIDAERLVTLMAGYTRPADQAAYDTLHANSAFEETWRTAWRLNAPPSVTDVPTQIINEDGTLSIVIRVTDDFTPNAGVTVTAQAVRTDNYNVEDLSLVNAPTVSTSTAAGDRTLTVTTKPNASGQVAIKMRAVDAGGVETTKVFLLTISPVADTPVVTQATTLPPAAPATRPTLALGSLGVDLQSALVDNDGSEVLTVQIAGVPAALSFSTGTNVGGGVWTFTAAQLPGLRILGPTSFSQNVQMTVTATSRETANNQVSSPSAPRAFNIDFNAAPTDIVPGNLTVNENAAVGTTVGTFTRTDPDSGESGGDAPTFSLSSNPGNLFAISAAGVLTTNAVFNREATASYALTVRVTDSGGLSYDKAFTIGVNDVNEAPGLAGSYAFSAPENTSIGAIVGTVAASDPDVNTPAFRDFRYELVGAPSVFSINATTGQIVLQSPGLNYEATTGYNFSVRVWDGGGIGAGNSATAAVSFAVGNVNEPTTINNPTIFVPETGGGPGVYLATITGSDPDGPLAYQLIGGGAGDSGNPGAFTINSAGQLFAQTSFNFEARQSYSVSVRTWDGGAVGAGNFQDNTVTVNIQDRPEPPSLSFAPKAPGPDTNWVGKATATDPDAGSTLTYSIISASQHLTQYDYESNILISTMDWWVPITANITSVGDLYASYTVYQEGWDSGGGNYGYIVHGFESAITIAAQDNTGLWSNQVTVMYYKTAAHVAPIALDLDGDGVELVSIQDSKVTYSLSDDTRATSVGWIGKDDALLALDRNHDGTISGRDEISFAGDVPNAVSDLEGLAAFDTNLDGYLDAGDARFAEFQVWQDRNQDGISQADELTSLADRGISAISLTRALTGATAAGAQDNVITATSTFVRTDGTTGTVGDVSLADWESRSEVVSETPVPNSSSTNDASSSSPRANDSRTNSPRATNPWTSDPRMSDLATNETSTDDPAMGDPLTSTPAASDPLTDKVDRRASGPVTPARVAMSGDLPELPTAHTASATEDHADAPRRSLAPRLPNEDDSAIAASRDRSSQDSQSNNPAAPRFADAQSGQAWENETPPPAAPSALHTSLDSVARRRLQMIDAMASFSADDSGMLELMPRRRVDAQTLQLLTAVAGIKTAA